MNALVRNVTFPMISSWEGNKKLSNKLSHFEESQYWSKNKIFNNQFEKLHSILNHAYRNVEFYRKRFDECGFNPKKINDFSDLKKIPILTKEEIRDNLRSLVAGTYNDNQLHKSLSGGTTGLVTEFYRDNACLLPKHAAVLWLDGWTGWKIGDWKSLVWPATLDLHGSPNWRSKIKNHLYGRQFTLAMTTIDEKLILGHLNEMRKRKPTMIRAFPSPLVEVAKYVIDHQLEGFSIKGIVTTGEPLYRKQREFIEQAFHCPVFDSYRTRENGPLAQECEMHKGYHINSECVFLETIPVENRNHLIDSDRIIVTDLLNYGMPFIRYEIGDLGTISNATCNCGRGLPLLEEVGGRLADVTYTPEGKKVASITLIPNLVHSAGIMSRVQIVQTAFDNIVIRIAYPKPPEENLNLQFENAKKIFGSRMRISFEFVEDIPFAKSGKYQFIQCKIPKIELDKFFSENRPCGLPQ